MAPSSRCPYDFTVRCAFGNDSNAIHGWPSRGGTIILDNADAIDLEFLGLYPLHPSNSRDGDQTAEDAFCQRLLLLGAKWWDSAERYFFVHDLRAEREGWVESLGHGDGSFRGLERPAPTIREQRWVCVAWPISGGLWVSEFDTPGAGLEDESGQPPDDCLTKVRLARTMDERCYILRDQFQAKFYPHISDYEGHAFLRAWEWKHGGEAGPLLSPLATYQSWYDNRTVSDHSTHQGGRDVDANQSRFRRQPTLLDRYIIHYHGPLRMVLFICVSVSLLLIFF